MSKGQRIRVLVAKVGLDGHDKGANLVALALRDAGMEVVYTGLRRTANHAISAAIEEDVDVIGVSILSGAHMKVADKIVTLMKKEGIEDKLFVMGGVIPEEDIPRLKEKGVAGVFTQSATYEEMIDFIREGVRQSREGGTLT
jgi:methylmalonyl-CoA mutase C-terminal domain/subunit